MPIVLGHRPDTLDVLLTEGADFHAALQAKVGGVERPWPAGTTITLEFGGGRDPDGADAPTTSWPATIAAEFASWDRSEADIAAVKAAGHLTARLTHKLGTADTVWATGRVRWAG